MRYEATVVQHQRPLDEVKQPPVSVSTTLPLLKNLNPHCFPYRGKHAVAPPRREDSDPGSSKTWTLGLQQESPETLSAWAAFQQTHGSMHSLLQLLKATELPACESEGLLLSEFGAETLRWIEVWNGTEWLPLDIFSWNVYPRAVTYDIRNASRLSSEPLVALFATSGVSCHHERFPAGANRRADRLCAAQRCWVPSFGIFIPVLMALAFRNTGLAIFGGAVFLAYAVRCWMKNFRLLLVPRLSAILTIVVLSLTALALVGNHFRLRGMMAIGLTSYCHFINDYRMLLCVHRRIRRAPSTHHDGRQHCGCRRYIQDSRS